jgi:ribosomal protein S17
MTAENTVTAAVGHELTGRVVSTKMDKTIAVAIDRLVKHSMYHRGVPPAVAPQELAPRAGP